VTCFAALQREVMETTAIPIIVNGATWWSNAARTRVAATKAELHAKLAAKHFAKKSRRG
jgi:hypothetical protein